MTVKLEDNKLYIYNAADKQQDKVFMTYIALNGMFNTTYLKSSISNDDLSYTVEKDGWYAVIRYQFPVYETPPTQKTGWWVLQSINEETKQPEYTLYYNGDKKVDPTCDSTLKPDIYEFIYYKSLLERYGDIVINNIYSKCEKSCEKPSFSNELELMMCAIEALQIIEKTCKYVDSAKIFDIFSRILCSDKTDKPKCNCK